MMVKDEEKHNDQSELTKRDNNEQHHKTTIKYLEKSK